MSDAEPPVNTHPIKKTAFSIKRFLPRTLFGRSLMILITPVVLIQVFTTFMFFDRHWSKVTTRLAYAVAGEVALLTHMHADVADDSDTLHRHAADNLKLDVVFREDAKIPTRNRTYGARIWEGVVADKLSAELHAMLEYDLVVHTDFSNKTVDVFVQVEDGVLKVSLPQRRLYSSSGYVFLLWMIGSSVLLLVISIIFMRNQVRPIRKLAAAAERFGKGRDTPYFKPEGAREVRQAGHAFIDMRRRIKRQVNQRTDMLAGVSHDLRTPLTRMKLQAAMMEEGVDKSGMQNDISDMERMIEGYLDFVRGEGDEAFALINIAERVEKIVLGLKRQSDVAYKLDFELDLACVVRPLAFERVIGNVLSNASRYADHIWVSGVYTTDQSGSRAVLIQVEDNGIGIPADQYEDMFKPFRRMDASRNSDTGGVGLGLTIVMDIVHAHGGKVWFSESSYNGLCVNIVLPQ